MRKALRGRRYLTHEQVLDMLGSATPDRIIGFWYRGDEVRCSDCEKQGARFTRVQGVNRVDVILGCGCGTIFTGTYIGRSFSVTAWFSHAYLKMLEKAVNRPEAKKNVRKLYALMGLRDCS